MYLCLPWVSLVEYLNTPPRLSWTEELIVPLAFGCFPWSTGRRTGSFMRCQGDRSTWPTLCCARVSPENAIALRRQFSGFAREQVSVDSRTTVQLRCVLFDVRQDVQAYAELGLWSVRSQEWWEHRTMNQTQLMIWMFQVCGELYNYVRRRSDWCSMKHKETICLGGQALSVRTFVLV